MRHGRLAQLLTIIAMSGPAFASTEYGTCILFQYQSASGPHLLLACDGEKVGEMAIDSREPAGLEGNSLVGKFEEYVKWSKLSECFENKSAAAWFKSCRK